MVPASTPHELQADDTRCPDWPGPECDFTQSLHVLPQKPLGANSLH
jgi:hypothetical protein